MPICTYLSNDDLRNNQVTDKAIRELLEEVNIDNVHKYIVEERKYEVKGRWPWSKKETKYIYQLLYGFAVPEYQVINFYRDHDWSINTYINKELIMAYLYGILGGQHEEKMKRKYNPAKTTSDILKEVWDTFPATKLDTSWVGTMSEMRSIETPPSKITAPDNAQVIITW